MPKRAARLLGLVIWALIGSGSLSGSTENGAWASCTPNGTTITTPAPGAVSKPSEWTITLPWAPGITHQVLNGYGTGDHQNTDEDLWANDYHALDFDLSLNEAVYPVAGGTVVYAGWATGGWGRYGKIVFMDHGNGYQSLYAHLNSIEAGIGAGVFVTPQTRIGGAGGSGGTSVHLHFALYKGASFQNSANGIGPYGGNAVVPEPFTGDQDYVGILAGQCLTSRGGGPDLRQNGDIWFVPSPPFLTDTMVQIKIPVKNFGNQTANISILRVLGNAPPNGTGGEWDAIAQNYSVAPGETQTITTQARTFPWPGTYLLRLVTIDTGGGNWYNLPANGYTQSMYFEVRESEPPQFPVILYEHANYQGRGCALPGEGWGNVSDCGEAERYTLEEAVARLIILAEAAKIYKELSHSHLGKLVREKQIWGVKIGHYWVTTREAVEGYLTQDRRPGPKPR